MHKGLQRYYSEIRKKVESNKNAIITSSLTLYLIFYLALGLGGFSYQSQLAHGYIADPDKPSSPQPTNETLIQDPGPQTVSLSAKYSDSDGHSGTLKFFERDTSNQIGTCSVNDGERCSVSWDAAHGDNWWYVVADDDGDDASTRSDDWFFTINQPPDKTTMPESPIPGDIVYSDSTNLVITVSDPDSDNLRTTFYDNHSSSEVTGPDSSGSTASVSADNLNRGETYKWWADVSDGWNSTKTNEWDFYVNGLPNVYDANPTGIIEDEDPELNIRASDDNSDALTAYFYNHSGEFLDKKTFNSGEKVSATYTSDTVVGQSYDWSVNVSDGFENSTRSYTFTRTTNINTRIAQRIDYEYSSIIMSNTETRDIFFEIENNVDDTKYLKTYADGVNATFAENNQKSIEYTLEPQSSKRFMVQIRPESFGQKYLNISTENQRFAVNTTTSIPVNVKNFSDVSETSEVSGIGFLQILMLLVISSAIYLTILS